MKKKKEKLGNYSRWKIIDRDFPGSPVVKAVCVHCRGSVGSIPGRGTKIPPAQKWKCYSFSRVQLFATPWTAAHLPPLSMEFSRKEY